MGDPSGTVAICTLASRELAAVLMEHGDPSIAIAGRCDTENIGVEKVVLNLIANPRVRTLILCGVEAQGHRAGGAFLQPKAQGVDANMRVLEAASWRPILKNLALFDVARFREQLHVVNLVGVTDPDSILAAARKGHTSDLPVLPDYSHVTALQFERIKASVAARLRLDPAGFFIVLPQADGRILLVHFENNGLGDQHIIP